MAVGYASIWLAWQETIIEFCSPAFGHRPRRFFMESKEVAMEAKRGEVPRICLPVSAVTAMLAFLDGLIEQEDAEQPRAQQARRLRTALTAVAASAWEQGMS